MRKYRILRNSENGKFRPQVRWLWFWEDIFSEDYASLVSYIEVDLEEAESLIRSHAACKNKWGVNGDEDLFPEVPY